MIELDISFIEKMLQKYENDDSILITDMHKSPACEKGENFMSVVLRVRIEGKRTINNIIVDYSISVIIKRPFQSEIMQLTFNSTEIFLNEVTAYNQIIPSLQEKYKLSLPVARCIYADKNYIILEDLSDEGGYQMQRHVVSMNIDQCLAVLQEMAVFHSASIIMKTRHPEKVTRLSKQIMEVYRPNNQSILEFFDKNIAVALTLLKKSEQTEKIVHTVEKLENCKHKIFKRVCDLLKVKKETNVFNHGDCWRNNILFKNTQSGIKVKLVDLQVMRYTSVAADLNYFLYINLIPEIRKRNLDLFLDTYLNAFHRAIAEHNLEVNYQLYSRDWLVQEMADFEVFGFMCSLWISPAFYFDKKNLPDMDNIKPEELDADYHKDFILKHMTPGLKERILSLVVDFVHTYKF